jgi:RNA polymerase sigma-70 factor (ECF subfamily)
MGPRNYIERFLIDGTKTGNAKSVDRLFVVHQKCLFNLLYQLCDDIRLTDDMAQETVFQAHKKIRLFWSESSFRTWISRLANNLFRKEAQKRLKSEHLHIDKIQILEKRDHPERIVLRGQLQRCIIPNLHYHVPLKYRLVLILRDLQDLSYSEIADILGYNIDRVKTNFHRARHMFWAQFVDGRCLAFVDDYLCMGEGMLEL